MLSGIPLFPEQASNFVPEVDNLYFFVTAVTAGVALLVVVLVLVFAVKYRDKTGEKVGASIHRSLPLELGWAIIPFLVTMVIFAWATAVFFDMVRAPDQALDIYSTGKRGVWRFQHIDGQSEINELHVPLGRPVKVTFTSEDVLHSLYVPAFRVKADANSGALQFALVHRYQAGRGPSLLRGVLRDRALGDDRQGGRHGAERRSACHALDNQWQESYVAS